MAESEKRSCMYAFVSKLSCISEIDFSECLTIIQSCVIYIFFSVFPGCFKSG